MALIVLWALVGAGWVATIGLDSSRYYDERYVLENVRPILAGEGFRPVNGWYPRLSYLPQTALLAISRAVSEATGSERLAIFTSRGWFSPTAYLICRWLNCIFGAGALIVTFLIGRRMFSPAVGLLAALFQSMAPWHIHASGIFKPDPLLLLLMSSTFYWSLTAIERGTLRTYLLCGAGIGLAASAKTPGAFAAIPLITLSLLEPLRRSRWIRLLVAGIASIVVFSVVNQYPLYYLGVARTEQAWLTGDLPEQSSLAILRWVVRMPVDTSFFGPVLGTVALAGLAGLAVLLFRQRHQKLERTRLTMFLSLPLVYPIAVSVLTDYTKGNYLLPLLPLAAIAAGWILVLAWQWTAGRLSYRPQRVLVWPATIALVFLAGRQGLPFVYVRSLPTTTLSRAGQVIKDSVSHLDQRLALFEPDVGTLKAVSGRRTSSHFVAAREIAPLSAEPEEVLDRVDFEVFGLKRLHGPERDFYLRRMLRLGPGQVAIVEPEWFRVRGSPQVVLLHPWRASRALPIEWEKKKRRKGRFVGRIPAALWRGQLISLDFTLPEDQYSFKSLIVGDLSLVPVYNGFEGNVLRFRTERFFLTARNLKVQLLFDHKWAHKKPPSVSVLRWTPGRSTRERG